MFSKYEELNFIEDMLVTNGKSEEDVKPMIEAFDAVYELGLSNGYKLGRADEILSQMMGDKNGD